MEICIFCGNIALHDHICVMRKPDEQPKIEPETFSQIEQDFIDFHAKSPEVYKQLVRLAREWKSAGNAKLGIATLFEKLRWEWHVAGLKDVEGYKLNNNYRSLYARLIMANESDLDGIFELRQLRAA